MLSRHLFRDQTSPLDAWARILVLAALRVRDASQAHGMAADLDAEAYLPCIPFLP